MTNNKKNNVLFVYGKFRQIDIERKLKKHNIDKIIIYCINKEDNRSFNKKFRNQKNLKIITRNNFSVSELHKARSFAFDYIDKVYQYLNNKNLVPEKWAVNKFEDSNIALIFRKQVIELLGEWLIVEFILNRHIGHDAEVTILVKDDIAEIANIFRQLFYNTYIGKVIGCRPFNSKFGLIKNIVLFVFLPVYSLLSVRRIRFSSLPLYFSDIAVRLNKSSHQKSTELFHEGYDVLEKYNNKDKRIIYIAEQTLCSELTKSLLSNSQHCIQLGRGGFDSITWDYFFLALMLQLKAIKEFIPLFYKSSFIFHSLSTKIHFDLLRWTNFCLNYKIKWYTSFNNKGKSHITRNIILKKYGIRTFSYETTITSPFFMNKFMFNSLRNPDRAYTIYDVRSYIYDKQMQFDLRHGALMDNSLITGVLLHDENKIIFKNIFSNFTADNKKRKIISLFTVSTGSMSMNSEVELTNFFDLACHLLKDPRFKEYSFCIKIKGGSIEDGRHSKELIAIYEDFINNERVFEVKPTISANAIIQISDFVLSMAFTSPTLEALANGKAAGFVFHDKLFQKSIFSDHTELVNRSLDDIWNNLEYFSAISKDEIRNLFFNLFFKNKEFNANPRSGYQIIMDYISN